MSDWRDRSDHAEGCVLGHRQTVVAADGVALQEFDPRDELHDLQFLDLVIEAADLGFFEFHAAQLFGLLVANAIDAGDGLGAIFHRDVAELLESARRRGHRVIDGAKDTPIAVGVTVATVHGSAASALAQLGQHLLHDLSNGLFVGLNHPYASSILCAVC